MNAIQNFFLVCSGAHRSILNRTPSEINRYVGIGATIFFTGLFATMAGAYALFTIFQSYSLAIIFGIFWGLMIFNLDRYIVSTMKKKGSFFKDFFISSPRIALAILIAFVIAKPLELKIFESEINAEIALMQQENILEQEALVDSRFNPRIEALNTNILDLKNEIQTKTAHRDKLINEALIEADGTGGSQKRNMGPIYAAKKAEADKAEKELAQLEATNAPLISAKQEQLDVLNEQKSEALEELSLASLNGFAARLEALRRLCLGSEAIFFASIFITLLFIAIETAPIFVKLISERGPYDYVLHKHEHVFEMHNKANVSALQLATDNKIDFNTKTSRYKTNLAIEAEKELSRQALQDHLESIKQQPLVWKDLLRKGKLFQLD